MNQTKKYVRTLGKPLKKTKSWVKATEYGETGGEALAQGLIIAGAASGHPEIAGVGAGVMLASKGSGKASKLLKKVNSDIHRKRRNKKKKNNM